ncbi:MAG TPA: hypothetical protein VGA56_19950 [Opitutaceae bacterium]
MNDTSAMHPLTTLYRPVGSKELELIDDTIDGVIELIGEFRA